MTADPKPPASPGRAPGYILYAVGLLLVINLLNFLDRQVISILSEPIKRDLRLADWQLGLMNGPAFALLYAVLALPIARWAERGDRPLILVIAVAVWSAFTGICGLAQTFVQLLAARVGVGIGEAGCTPTALSLISDYAPRRYRAGAISIFMLGAPIGGLAGMSIGGLVADAWSWRTAFLAVGLPGVVIALLAAATLPEPRRKRQQVLERIEAEEVPSFGEALTELSGKRSYRFIVAAICAKAFVSYGTTAFIGSFFFRNHAGELDTLAASYGLGAAGFLGIALGLITGGAGIMGALIGGVLADRFGSRDPRAYVTIAALDTFIVAPFYIAGLWVESTTLAFALLLVPGMLNTLWYGPAYAAIQGLVRPRTRATASALMLFCSNLIGLGIGPFALGFTSDLIGAHLGSAEGIRWSLTLFAILTLPSAALFFAARRTIREETVS